MNTLPNRLNSLKDAYRPFYKLLFSKIEGAVGHRLYRKFPPVKGAKNLLNLGCGNCFFDGWVNTDYYRFSNILRKDKQLPDWMLDATKEWRCRANYWDGIHTEHMLEHVDYASAIVVLSECYRTLKDEAWIRVVLPGVELYINHERYKYKAEAIAALSLTHGHSSIWDAALMIDLLKHLGFKNVREVAFGEGANPEIIKDLSERNDESFYVEAQK